MISAADVNKSEPSHVTKGSAACSYEAKRETIAGKHCQGAFYMMNQQYSRILNNAHCKWDSEKIPPSEKLTRSPPFVEIKTNNK